MKEGFESIYRNKFFFGLSYSGKGHGRIRVEYFYRTVIQFTTARNRPLPHPTFTPLMHQRADQRQQPIF